MQAKKIFFVFLFSPKEEAVKADRRSDAHKGEAEKVRKSTTVETLQSHQQEGCRESVDDTLITEVNFPWERRSLT